MRVCVCVGGKVIFIHDCEDTNIVLWSVFLHARLLHGAKSKC